MAERLDLKSLITPISFSRAPSRALLDNIEVGYGGCGFMSITFDIVERSSSVIEHRTLNRERPGSNPPFATVSKSRHFRSLHDAPVH